MASFEQSLIKAKAEYAQHLAEWQALNPAPPRYTGEFYRPSRRITIERERGDVVYRSQCPYVGIARLIKGVK